MDVQAYAQRYTAADVSVADRERLLLLVFEGGLKFLRLAREGLVAGDAVRFSGYLSRAQAIIAELASTLDHEAGGEIAGNLARLYEFMLFHLTEANARRSVRHMDEVIRVFGTIADAFQTVLAGGTAAP
jgi:flagellar secretion chaperone FliS